MSQPSKPPPMSRRGALAVIGGLGAAGAASACRPRWAPPESDPFSRAVAKPYVPGAEFWSSYQERWFDTTCGECPAGCGVKVRVVEGRAVRVEGNHAYPINRGGIGPRGLSALQGLYDAERLTGPMKRVAGQLVPIGWDDALGELAGALERLRAAGEPERLLVWTGQERGILYDLFARFCRAYGTPNFVDGSPGHSAVLIHAMEQMTGVADLPVYGWGEAGYVLSLEAGLFEDSCQLVYFTRMAAQLRREQRRRARLVHAGPMLDLSAANADEWVRLRPGTSGALALGLAHHLLDRHRDELHLPTDLAGGVDGFHALVGGFGSARVEAITGVPAHTQLRLAEELWRERPSLVVVGERSLAYSNGLDTALAALALNALLGAFWQPAGGIRPAPRVPLRDWPDVDLDRVALTGLGRPRLDGAADPARIRAIHESLPEAIAAAGDRGPAVALLHYTNPAYARQQPQRWRQALARIPLVVSFSPYRDETVDAIAHLVLPDHTSLERWEAVVPAPALERAAVGLRQPVVAPVHATRSTGDVMIELARRLGGSLERSFDWRSFRDASQVRLLGLHDSVRGNLIATTPAEFLRAFGRTGYWLDGEPPPPPPVKVDLPAAWSEPEWFGDTARYPLGLVVYRPLGHAEGGPNRPWLRMLRPRLGAKAWSFTGQVNPASVPGYHDGQRVRLESEWGAIDVDLLLDERMEPGYIAVPLGSGHRAFGHWAEGFGANVLDLVRPGAAAETGADLLCATRVRIAGGTA